MKKSAIFVSMLCACAMVGAHAGSSAAATKAAVARPLIPVPGGPGGSTPMLTIGLDQGCPDPFGSLRIGYSAARGTAVTRADDINLVDVYVLLFRPDGHFYRIDAPAEQDVLQPTVAGWSVADIESAELPLNMADLPINEAGLYEIVAGFVDPATRDVLAVSADSFYAAPPTRGRPLVPVDACGCAAGTWSLTVDYKEEGNIMGSQVMGKLNGTLRLRVEDVVRQRPFIPSFSGSPLPDKVVTSGTGTLAYTQQTTLGSACGGGTGTTVNATATGEVRDHRLYLTLNWPSKETIETLNCAGYPIEQPLTVTAYQNTFGMPAANGAGRAFQQYEAVSALASDKRPLVPVAVPGGGVRTVIDLKLSCN